MKTVSTGSSFKEFFCKAESREIRAGLEEAVGSKEVLFKEGHSRAGLYADRKYVTERKNLMMQERAGIIAGEMSLIRHEQVGSSEGKLYLGAWCICRQ